MDLKELKGALRSGVPVVWQGKRDYESAIGRLTRILIGVDPSGEFVYSCEITSSSTLSGRTSVYICRPDEVRLWRPEDGARGA